MAHIRTKEQKRDRDMLTKDDYFQLLKCLNINLPAAVVTQEVVELANSRRSIEDAEAILEELEKFVIQFRTIPRLPCGKLKRYLKDLKDDNIIQITKLLFFKKDNKDKKEQRENQWRENTSITDQGFRLRDKYKTTAVSTPALNSTAMMKRRRRVSPIVSEGTAVTLSDVEGTDYSDESELWKNGSPGGFGMFRVNKQDQLQMLKFFHESQEVKKTVTYSKGNKVEYGFLSGRLDFLAVIKQSKATPNSSDRLVIECKSTTRDRVEKIFTESNFQVQAYMYIMNRESQVKEVPQMTEAVMVVRHYHRGGTPPLDIKCKYLQIEQSVQDQIEELRLLCQGEVLARYLALLNLIFQKESKVKVKKGKARTAQSVAH